MGDGSGSGTSDGTIYDDIVASKWLNSGSNSEWTTEEISFKTNKDQNGADVVYLGIDFRVIKNVHYYIDNVRLLEVR